MDVSDLIAIKIQELMKEENISVYKLEELTGIPNSTLYFFFNRTHKSLRIENLVYICQALDIELGEFFSDPRFENVEAKDWHKNQQ